LAKHIAEIKEADIANMKKRANKTKHTIDEEDTTGHGHDKDIYDYEVSGKLKTGFKRPVMIHRAIFGSLERCFAILTEVYGGKWPFWLSPRQAIVIPVSKKYGDYAQKVSNRLHYEGFHAEADLGNGNIKKKIRNAQMSRFNYFLVVGATEVEEGTVTVRKRDEDKPIGTMKVQEVVDLFRSLDPEQSSAWKKLKEESFFNECDHNNCGHDHAEADAQPKEEVPQEEAEVAAQEEAKETVDA